MPGLSAAEINVSLGGIVVSNYLSYLTMGIVLSAAWTYFSKFPNDTWWFKVPVIVCVTTCVVDTIVTGIWSYDWAVTNYANPSALSFIPRAAVAEPFLFGTCGLIVQLFYAWRLWTMSMRKNWILSLLIGCLSVLGWCILCWSTHIFATHSLISELDIVLPVIYIWLGGSVAADVIITGSMIYYLDLRFRFKKNTKQNQATPPRRFRQIIIRTVECNILSCIAQAATIGLFNHSNIGFFYVVPDMVLAKVYTFSLLVSLNIRSSHQNYGTSGGFSTSRTHNGGLTTLPTAVFPSTQITVDTELEAAGDWQEQTKESMSSAKEHDTHVMLSQV
ncbi:hypothetical protein BT96DRAFT_1017781 [Gymnopus androsaceus JB14]|uniref:DUF6534 domain-containing protein n=1 Tax=Gymnopus androsaceus JB14 TaxID=1447944 RepID=A0A6A4HYE1_9AGAR|nr:hypothetical protein BT96DRAFT_1017781 [Gymnopus androsaceus JB14]